MTTSASAKRKMTVAEFLSAQIDLSEKSQKQIATEVGFPKPNMITMLKKGESKVPMAKIPSIAEALGIDKLHFYRMVMEEYEPGIWNLLQESILKQPIITDNELSILTLFRDFNLADMKIEADEDKAILLEALQKIDRRNTVSKFKDNAKTKE